MLGIPRYRRKEVNVKRDFVLLLVTTLVFAVAPLGASPLGGATAEGTMPGCLRSANSGHHGVLSSIASDDHSFLDLVVLQPFLIRAGRVRDHNSGIVDPVGPGASGGKDPSGSGALALMPEPLFLLLFGTGFVLIAVLMWRRDKNMFRPRQ